MIQLQVLNFILQNKSLEIAHSHQITEDYFPAYKPEFSFIQDHFVTHAVVPDRVTFLNTFPDFDLFDVAEPESYLVDALHEEYLFSLIPPLVEQLQTHAEKDSRAAVKFLLDRVSQLSTVASLRRGYDVVARANDRVTSYNERMSMNGLLGITSGYSVIDDALHGWLDQGDLIIVGARTNEGKSWVMEEFAKNAWMAGKRVLYYSGEMSAELMAFRFDTLFGHFSNRALLSGKSDLGDKTADDYYKYAADLTTHETPFIVVTPTELGQRLDVSLLRSLVARHKSDIVFLDQLTLMEDSRGNKKDAKYQKLGNITSDLREFSNLTKIPVMAAHQVRRNNTGRKQTPEDIPELDDLYQSDEIAHNATRVIVIKQVPGKELKMTVRKNTFGERELTFLFSWDIDKGTFVPKTGGNFTQTVSSQPGNEGDEIF